MFANASSSRRCISESAHILIEAATETEGKLALLSSSRISKLGLDKKKKKET
jgi:hypothetical protein